MHCSRDFCAKQTLQVNVCFVQKEKLGLIIEDIICINITGIMGRNIGQKMTLNEPVAVLSLLFCHLQQKSKLAKLSASNLYERKRQDNSRDRYTDWGALSLMSRTLTRTRTMRKNCIG